MKAQTEAKFGAEPLAKSFAEYRRAAFFIYDTFYTFFYCLFSWLCAFVVSPQGLDVEDSLSLSDSYIQKCELMNNMERIFNLQYHMVLDYSERVEKLRLGKSPTKLAVEVANYIQHHLSEAISTEDIANALFMSRCHLSTKFKAETGETLVDFILKEKTEEAKRLLRYTDKTAVSISNYLGFSSQSHFSRVFKKYTGKSPNEYREKLPPYGGYILHDADLYVNTFVAFYFSAQTLVLPLYWVKPFSFLLTVYILKVSHAHHKIQEYFA